MDREEFFRLKKVKGIKEKAAQAEDKKHGERDDIEPTQGGAHTDVLGEDEDNDVIF